MYIFFLQFCYLFDLFMFSSDSSSDGQSSKGKKRPNPMSASAIESKLRKDIQKSTTPVQAPLCRPWDREDLMKRLATFKSMTWFAKPKVHPGAHFIIALSPVLFFGIKNIQN